MTERPAILVLEDGKPVLLGKRTREMVRVIINKGLDIEQQDSGCVELHYGQTEVQGFLRQKMGRWKID